MLLERMPFPNLLTAALLMLGGCAGMVATPEHQRPETVQKAAWSWDLAEEYAIDPAWWRAFGDPQLDEL
ncbi:MAG TPA: hypothetical protein VF210_18515, partial [Pseudomonadales bacterium]